MSATWTATVDEVVWTATDFPTVTFETLIRSATGGGGGGGTVDVVSNVATGTILGRATAGTGDSEELSASSARTVMGLGTAATAAATDFLASGSGSNTANGWLKLDGSATIPDILIPASIARDSEVTAAIAAAAQPLDSDLTAIAALTTTSYGRSLLTLANEAALWALHPPVSQVRGCPTAAANDWVLLSTPFGSATTVSVLGGSATLSSGRAIYLPFTVDRAISVTGLGIEVSTGNAGGSAVLRLGIHSDSGGRPGSVLVDTTATATAAAKEATFSSTALAPGHYWAVIAFQSLDTAGVNPLVRIATSPASTANRTAMVTGSNQGATYTATVSGALAATPTVSLTTPIVPNLFLKVGTP